MINNVDVRQEITVSGFKFWQVADRLGISEGTFSRRLRRELPPADKDKIRAIIKELQAKKE